MVQIKSFLQHISKVFSLDKIDGNGKGSILSKSLTPGYQLLMTQYFYAISQKWNLFIPLFRPAALFY